MEFVTGYVLYAPGRGYVTEMDIQLCRVYFAEDIWDAVMYPDWPTAVTGQHWVLGACSGEVSSVGIHPISLNCGGN